MPNFGKILDINGHKVFLAVDIRDVLVTENLTIVRLHDDKTHGQGDRSMDRNVLAFDQEANFVWKIQEAPHGGDEWPKPYIRLTMQGTKLVASNWIGVDYVADLTTGNVDAGKSEGRPW